MNLRGGLVRVALDLHVHTPGSLDWADGPVDPTDIVDRALTVGLDGIAVTDHHTGAWVDRLREAATDTPLWIVPGVEINALAGNAGVHVLALFPLDTTTADIDRFLGKVGSLTGRGKDVKRGSATAGALQVLDTVEEFHGIAVLAHCRSTKGVLAEMRGELRTRVVRHRAVLAVESPSEDFWDDARRASRRRTYDLLNGEDSNYKRQLAVYQSSDNPSASGGGHGLAGIGSRYTYFWIEKPLGLESLRQCFIDREVRIAYPPVGETHPVQIARVACPQVTRLRVTGGFLDGLDLELHPGLNSVLGAKGSGKSLLVEFLRFALNQPPTQPEVLRDHEAKLRLRLQGYGRVLLTVCDGAGKEYTIERQYDPAAGNPYNDVPFEPSELFPCHFLSQGEIVRVAESAEEQLRFIDSFFDFHLHQREIAAARDQLGSLDVQVAEQTRAQKKATELRKQHVTLVAQIEQKDKELASPVFAKFRGIQEKTQAMDRYIHLAQQTLRTVRDAHSAVEAVPNAPDAPEALASDPALLRMKAALRSSRGVVGKGLAEAIGELEQLIRQLESERATWAPQHQNATDEYTRTIRTVGGDVPALNQARSRLVAQRENVEKRLAEVELRSKQLLPTLERRNEALTQLDSARDAYTRARSERCEWFTTKSDGQIRAVVEAAPDNAAFAAKLNDLKRGSYLAAHEIDQIAGGVSPRQLVRAILRYDLGAPTTLTALADDCGVPASRLLILADFLLQDAGHERIMGLEHMSEPNDRPRIEFRREDGTYSLLDELSTGQKCTALLVMALCEGDKPIVVDQPEDSLDIRSIWEDMCTRVRGSKRERQFVFTTHNSSLAVASDSDRFAVLAASSTHGQLVMAGALDSEDMRVEVIRLLEGGDQTYFLKQRKYNATDPSYD